MATTIPYSLPPEEQPGNNNHQQIPAPPPPPPTENSTPAPQLPISNQPPIGPQNLVLENPNSPKNISPNPNSDHEPPSPSSPAKLEENPKSNPPSSLPLGVPLLLQPAASPLPTKPQIAPWTHQETVNLIQAYQEKWYSVNRGPLKGGQWEEVAVTVAERCGYHEPTKTAKQCRGFGQEEGEEGVVGQLEAEIKGFAEKIVKMENKKIEMIKEVERYRLEMEDKRMEMILESQQMLLETVNKAFNSCYKTQKLSAN